MTTLAEALQAELGDDWRSMLDGAEWSAPTVQAEMSTPGWKDRLAEAIESRRLIRANVRLGIVLQDGPTSLSNRTLAELTALIKAPVLRSLAEAYVPAEHGGRLVLGPTGVGKTVAGVAVVRRLIEQRLAQEKPQPRRFDDWTEEPRPAKPQAEVWTRALDLPNARLQVSLGKGEAEAVTIACRAEFLVLDDMGWESARAGAQDVVLEVLAKRYDAGLVTYVTSGLKKPEFFERYGEAVVRRITEAGGKPGKLVDLWGKG